MNDITTAQRTRDLVVGALAAVTAGDLDTFLASMHPQVQVHEPAFLPYGGLYEGPEEFTRLFTEAQKVLDLTRVQLISATADEERTVLLMTIPLLGTGEVMHITEHWRVEHGVITDVRVFWFDHPDFTR